MARKYTNERCEEHDYATYAIIKPAQVGDINVNAYPVSRIVAYHQHQRELVQCHKMHLPDLQSL